MSFVYFEKNEIKPVWITVYERDGATVTVATADFEVFDTAGASKQASASATITDNGTATPDISGVVDTSVAAFTAGSTYKVQFTVVIGTNTYIRNRYIRLNA